jgi:prevent-host-death family protein
MGQRAVSVAEAKRSLSELLSRVTHPGESIVIVKRGKPVARLVPATPHRRPSLADVRGWLTDADPFFATMDAVVAARHARRPRRAPLPRRRS